MELTITGRAMGSVVEIVVVGGDHDADDLGDAATIALRRLSELESRWSRFLGTSDISRLNAAGGSPVHVRPETIVLVQHMVDAWRVTDGSFDPTLLGAIVGLGYVASWDDPGLVGPSVPFGVGASGRPGEIEVDAAAGVVRLPVGTAIDPGALGKGLAADLVAVELMEAGMSGVLVGVGGDVRVTGDAPQEGGWAIGLQNPFDRVEHAQVRLIDGGVATSGTDRRRWQHEGRSVHHVLDPATGTPVDTQIVSVTVVSGSGAWSEALATASMVLGVEHGFELVERLGSSAHAVMADGSIEASASWSRLAVVSEPSRSAEVES